VLFALLYLIAVAAGAVDAGFDAHAYWTARLPDPYAESKVGAFDAFLYSPAFAQAFAPLTLLPWTAFLTVWSALNIAVYLALTGPFALPLAFLPPVFGELHLGNIHVLLAGMIVAGFRWPGLWAFGVLTKVTPGVGLLWFLARREWRQLAFALGTTMGIVIVSFVVAPSLWFEWVALLAGSTSVVPPNWTLPIPLLPRVLAAAALVVWGARTDRRWVLPIAVTLSLPVVWGASFAILVALIPLLRGRASIRLPWRRRAVDPGVPGSVAT